MKINTFLLEMKYLHKCLRSWHGATGFVFKRISIPTNIIFYFTSDRTTTRIDFVEFYRNFHFLFHLFFHSFYPRYVGGTSEVFCNSKQSVVVKTRGEKCKQSDEHFHMILQNEMQDACKSNVHVVYQTT